MWITKNLKKSLTMGWKHASSPLFFFKDRYVTLWDFGLISSAYHTGFEESRFNAYFSHNFSNFSCLVRVLNFYNLIKYSRNLTKSNTKLTKYKPKKQHIICAIKGVDWGAYPLSAEGLFLLLAGVCYFVGALGWEKQSNLF